MKFVLTIEMGNAAMSTGEDLADALAEVAALFDHDTDRPTVGDEGRIRDRNGNTVGSWKVDTDG